MKNNTTIRSPQITILVPVHNGENYLESALESVYAQTFSNFECIILDDGSTDRTPDILHKFEQKDPRFRAVRLEKCGLVSTLNLGINLVSTKWIARLDADDVMKPERLERQLAFVESHPNISIAASYVRYIDEEGKIFGNGHSRFTSTNEVQQALSEGDLIGLHHPSILARTDTMKAMNGYREEAMLAEDTDLWTRMAEHGYEILVQPEYLTMYRIHGKSVSRVKIKAQNQMVAWLKTCLLCRNDGKPEPSWECFLEMLECEPLWKKLDRFRRATAKNLYKEATLSFARSMFFHFIFQLGIAAILRPSHVFKQIRTKRISTRTEHAC